MMTQQTLQAVILAVPPVIQGWRGRRHVRALSRLARVAVRHSARRAGGRVGRLVKNAEGVPQPSHGWHWSVAHKPAYVAGIVGFEPLGIDIEPCRKRSVNLLAKIADDDEWRLGSEDRWCLFYRFWTAKEAVLKAVGTGMRGLSDCRVVGIQGALRLTLAFRGQPWVVQQCFRNGHWAAVASRGDPVIWHWPGCPPETTAG
jgi:4'-phosphopantetheinyl transferase